MQIVSNRVGSDEGCGEVRLEQNMGECVGDGLNCVLTEIRAVSWQVMCGALHLERHVGIRVC